MLNLIKADFYRILRGKAIYICMLFILLSGFVSALTISPGHVGLSVSSSTSDIMNDPEFFEKLQKANSITALRDVMKSQGEFKLDREILGQNVNLYYVFIAITVVTLCVDFSNRTVKNTLSSSISRKKYYLSKVITIFTLSTFILVFNNLSAYLINYFMNGIGYTSSLKEILELTIIQMPLIYGIISLLIAFAFVFGKTSVFNTIAIPFIMVVQLIGLGIINLFRIKADWFYNYEIQFALAKLANNPSSGFIIKCVCLGFIYIVLFNSVGYLVFKNKEIK